MREVQLYDTMRGAIAPLELVDGQLTIYTCGPTVYAAPQIGNYRTCCVEGVTLR